MADISVITITKNTEHTIASVVRNALAIGKEHIVVDTGSIDRTPDIAAREGALVIFYPTQHFNYSTPRNVGSRAASNPWVLHLDSDEFIDPTFKSRIEQGVDNGKYDLFCFGQQTIFPGNETQQYKLNLQQRLFRRDKLTFKGEVFEQPYPCSPTGFLDVLLVNNITRDYETNEQVGQMRQEAAQREEHRLHDFKVRSSADAAYLISRYKNLSVGQCASLHELLEQVQKDAKTIEQVQRIYGIGLYFNPEDEMLHIQAASFYDHKEMPKMARQIMNNTWIKSPSVFYRHVRALYTIQVDTENALDDIEGVILEDPSSQAYHVKGACLFLLGQVAEAGKAIGQGLELFPESPLLQKAYEQTVGKKYKAEVPQVI